jgi:Raf kinase inhibitor-like YbhB/YbcL family protein
MRIPTLVKIVMITTFTTLCTVLTSPVGSSAIESPGMQISSPAFADGATIPQRYTCMGVEQSPPLTWSGVPTNAKTLGLIVVDPDAPSGAFEHWVVYNIPPQSTGLKEGKPKRLFPGGGEEGMNGAGKMGYFGPCPPPGKVHHYHFRLFALDKNLDLGLQPDAKSVRDAMNGHTIMTAEMVGIFSR